MSADAHLIEASVTSAKAKFLQFAAPLWPRCAQCELVVALLMEKPHDQHGRHQLPRYLIFSFEVEVNSRGWSSTQCGQDNGASTWHQGQALPAADRECQATDKWYFCWMAQHSAVGGTLQPSPPNSKGLHPFLYKVSSPVSDDSTPL